MTAYSLTPSLRSADRLSRPGVECWHACRCKISKIASRDAETRHRRARCDQQVGLRESVSRRLTSLHHSSPLEDDFFIQFENATFEPGAKVIVEPAAKPILQLPVRLALDAVADLGKRDPTQIEPFRRLRVGPGSDRRVTPRPTQLRDDVGVDQEPLQSSTSRTGLRSPSNSKSTSRSGDCESSS